MQDDKSRESSRRSEADSEEAVQDVCALSQEGSLGSFSDSDRSFKLRMAAAAECVSAPFLSCKLPLQASSGQSGYTGSTDRVVFPLSLAQLGCTHPFLEGKCEDSE